MKTVFKRRANRLAVSGKVDPLRLARGHAPRKSGAGVHADRRLRRQLFRLTPREATRRYLEGLRKAERGRPRFETHGFRDPAAVAAYRMRVIDLSLQWLGSIAGRSSKPSMLEALSALVGLLQVVDDLLDWKQDLAHRRPSFVTAAIGKRSIHASAARRFYGELAGRSAQDPSIAPFRICGFFARLATLEWATRTPR